MRSTLWKPRNEVQLRPMSDCMRWSIGILISNARNEMMTSAKLKHMLTLVPCGGRGVIAGSTSSQDVAARKIHAHGLMIILSTQIGKAHSKEKVSPQDGKMKASHKKTLPKTLRQ